MNEVRELEKARKAAAVFAAAAAVFLVIACIVPQLFLNGLKGEIEPLAELAIEQAHIGNTKGALELAVKIKDTVESKLKLLKMMYGHEPVIALRHAANAAYELAKEGDRAQLLEELTAIKTELGRLYDTNRICAENLI